MSQYKVKYEMEVEFPARSLKEATQRADDFAEALETVALPNDNRKRHWWPETAVVMGTQVELW